MINLVYKTVSFTLQPIVYPTTLIVNNIYNLFERMVFRLPELRLHWVMFVANYIHPAGEYLSQAKNESNTLFVKLYSVLRILHTDTQVEVDTIPLLKFLSFMLPSVITIPFFYLGDVRKTAEIALNQLIETHVQDEQSELNSFFALLQEKKNIHFSGLPAAREQRQEFYKSIVKEMLRTGIEEPTLESTLYLDEYLQMDADRYALLYFITDIKYLQRSCSKTFQISQAIMDNKELQDRIFGNASMINPILLNDACSAFQEQYRKSIGEAQC